jgi:ketosteroid isomerase-like protein
MRKLVLSALLACFLALSGVTGAQEESEAAKVRALEIQLTDSYKQRQIEQLASLLDEDFLITFEDGSTLSKTGYVSFMASPSDHVEVAEMTDMKIRVRGTTAIVIGAYHEKGDTKGQAYDYHDRFTDIWIKKSGRWRLVASHYAVPVKQ